MFEAVVGNPSVAGVVVGAGGGAAAVVVAGSGVVAGTGLAVEVATAGRVGCVDGGPATVSPGSRNTNAETMVTARAVVRIAAAIQGPRLRNARLVAEGGHDGPSVRIGAGMIGVPTGGDVTPPQPPHRASPETMGRPHHPQLAGLAIEAIVAMGSAADTSGPAVPSDRGYRRGSMMRVRIIGRGRAGGSIARALDGVATVELLGRGDHRDAAVEVDVLVLALPDGLIAPCAQEIAPGDAVIAHMSGATMLSALAPHRRVASLHPLVSMPDPVEGARRLRGAWMAIAGDPVIERLADALDGRTFRVDEEQRVIYHATAAIAANHLVALMAQVERLAEVTNVPVQAFWELAAGALDNVATSGAGPALTGPVARQDWQTVRRHVTALPEPERPLYLALAQQAAALAGRQLPPDLTVRYVPGPS